ncbi:hypothetical protein WJX73_007898 [Symbiochloris irregularis]|uniref:Endonuclease n=1 Tax=Symbiochloris irregularis TaxID=706552 RepID=A0AAW1P2D5_9CHLO
MFSPRQLGIGIAIGATAGVAGTYLLLKPVHEAPTAPSAVSHPAAKYGLPQSNHLRLFEGYISDFDPRTRNPAYVLECITKESSSGEGNRESVAFYEDEGIDKRFRNRLDDFRRSGYDRGHLAPAADHKSSQAAMKATFSLSNISPQVGAGFNRDYWARFERFVKLLSRSCDRVYIATGPLYLPKASGQGGFEMQYPLIGNAPRLVAVPTHFFKVILAEPPAGADGSKAAGSSQKKMVVGAFVMPNAPIDPTTPLSAFAVPLTALEEASGLDFFPAYLNDSRRAALDTTALSWQALGRTQMQQATPALKAELLSLLAADPSLEPQAASSSGAPSTSQPQSPATKQRPMAVSMRPFPTGAGGMGAVHVCEHVDCKLPAEDWFQAAQAARNSSSVSSAEQPAGKLPLKGEKSNGKHAR